jgi:predicted phage-related endonuclease
MPKMIMSGDADTLFQLFPTGAEDEPIMLGEEADRLMDSIKAMLVDKDALEGMIDAEKNKLRAMLGDRAVGMTSRFKVTWKNQTTNRLNTTRLKAEDPSTYQRFTMATESRVLRFTEIKANKEA